MSIYNYEQAFGAADKTTNAMRKAIQRWFETMKVRPRKTRTPVSESPTRW